jgi:hypothetical protein
LVGVDATPGVVAPPPGSSNGFVSALLIWELLVATPSDVVVEFNEYGVVNDVTNAGSEMDSRPADSVVWPVVLEPLEIAPVVVVPGCVAPIGCDDDDCSRRRVIEAFGMLAT